MDEKTAEVFDAINTAYADVEVQHNAELSRLLLKHRRTLENGLAYRATCEQLTTAISQYLLFHQLSAPKALSELFETISKYTAQTQTIDTHNIWIDDLHL
ncbi:hypothetical protein FC83_GL000673 [Agrilactobacillus composti DSM 18527 = JCM 14202]|uniref:Bacteriocin immunity protein n=1 Tax=Agrilactobacillus composti DSM 18527 = JCM 14202 TaxID=1423734 RepID=A0A0R1XV01_9LACO|nr:bacteriocin immunity protein [Agrilactobacillus composti]KRM31609.1 hypothetical protein FC83_GL000673 [Agrilactobacillus composti DSM 18527 = JCM 14202]